jgi:hypothetical protein
MKNIGSLDAILKEWSSTKIRSRTTEAGIYETVLKDLVASTNFINGHKLKLRFYLVDNTSKLIRNRLTGRR